MTTDMIPTEPGFYWHRDVDEGSQEAFEWKPYHVIRAGISFAVEKPDGLFPVSLAFITGEWGARIPDPDETHETDKAIKHSILTAHHHVRDGLAEKFLVGILANSQRLGTEDGVTFRISLAYRYADAMIEERGKRNA